MTPHNKTKQESPRSARIRLMRLVAWPTGAVGAAGLGRLCLDGAESAPGTLAAVYAAMCFAPALMILIDSALPAMRVYSRRVSKSWGQLASRVEERRSGLPEAS
jgi:hypothetical protein